MKLSKACFLIWIFLQIVSVNTFAENVTFSPPQSISPAAGDTPQISTDSSGRYAYAIWEDTGTGDIKIFFSSDFGVTWTDTLGVFGNGQDPQITTDSSGRYVYAIWSDGLPGPIKVFFSSDFGVTWTDTAFSFGSGSFPQIITDSTGQFVYAIWTDGGISITIFFSSDFGATWGSAIGSFGLGFLPQIITDNSGKFVYATWREFVALPPPFPIKIFRSVDFGATWGSAIGSFGEGFNPQVITNSSGKFVYAIWREPTTNNIKIFSSSDFGANLADIDPSDTIFGKGNSPQIITDNSGKFIYAIWREATTNNVKIFISSDFGVTWTDLDPSNTFGKGNSPQIIIDNSGRYIYAIWEDNISGNIKIFFSSDFGSSWTNADPTDTIFGTGITPQIIIDNIGRNIYGIWDATLIDITRGLSSFFPINRLSTSRE